MLRQLVSSSLQDYLAFFRQHAAVQPLDPQQDQAMWSCLPVFDTELVVQDGKSHWLRKHMRGCRAGCLLKPVDTESRHLA